MGEKLGICLIKYCGVVSGWRSRTRHHTTQRHNTKNGFDNEAVFLCEIDTSTVRGL